MPETPAVTSVDVRRTLVEALWLDFVGPTCASGCGFEVGDPHELLPEAPSRWYLTGFLVPSEAGIAQAVDPTEDDELEAATLKTGFDDESTPDKAAARRSRFPSSIGLSLLVPRETQTLTVTAYWGDYAVQKVASEGADGKGPWQAEQWVRTPKQGDVTVPLGKVGERVWTHPVPDSNGLQIAATMRSVPTDGGVGRLPAGTRSISVFLVNHRTPAPDETADTAFAFQAELDVTADTPITPRPNTRGLDSDDWDERVADLQYRDTFEFAVGHNVSTDADHNGPECRRVRTCWLPQAEVERVAPTQIEDVELSMDALAVLGNVAAARKQLGGFVSAYRSWIANEESKVPQEPARRRDIAKELLNRCGIAASRIEAGIELLADEQVLEAFRIANRVMATAARRRLGVMQGRNEADVRPAWRPFQLAFLLMNLRGIAQPTHEDRGVVDLLFFPTGGGKTEAYLGLAAFTLVLRRMRNEGVSSAGLSVLMRYTLRLLTLDQLGRAATLICALELERQQDVEKLGTWPFEIGLWVGQAATPNRMGDKDDKDDRTARRRTIAYKNNSAGKPSPIPLEDCPWCGEKFKPASFQLVPHQDRPRDLRVVCANRDCAFTRDNALPIVSVDEPIYRRLPCFMIATVDKFAALPWTGEVGKFFGRADRYDARDGFYGPCDSEQGTPLPGGRLLPPDLIIQDELHLISGPLGTIAGLYEAALDELCVQEIEGQQVRPKIVASTATVRRAQAQIRALFDRKAVDVFPPPGPDRRDSFFAEVEPPSVSPARLYLGVAGLGRSAKVVMLRTYLALLASSQLSYEQFKNGKENPADPYMTLLGYFNSLRELGGARRVVEDEITNRLTRFGQRKRANEEHGTFANRQIAYEVVELTSRIATDKVAESKRRLAQRHTAKDHVDVALATNMISVGLDITRLGLMVLFGQPKSSAEYIQATSRVGRDVTGRPTDRPGLVVTILNPHKPRDRSHYERFAAYHESFYRAVEATSVTPFSPRAMDRAIAAATVALSRHGLREMTPPRAADGCRLQRSKLNFVVDALADRAARHTQLSPAQADALRERVRTRVDRLLDVWSELAESVHQDGSGPLKYGDRSTDTPRLLHHFLDAELETKPRQYLSFRANRSMRDVEPSVNLLVQTLDGQELTDDTDS